MMVILDEWCLPYGRGHYTTRVFTVDTWGADWYSPWIDEHIPWYWLPRSTGILSVPTVPMVDRE